MVRSSRLRMKSRAQVSIEYLIVFGVAFMMTLPLVVIYAKQTVNAQADITQAQTYSVASKISDYAEQVYYMGSPAQRTLYINFPDGITSVSVQGSMITFNITTSDLSYQMVKETAANLTGTIKNFEGPHVIVFQAINNYVNITDQ